MIKLGFYLHFIDMVRNIKTCFNVYLLEVYHIYRKDIPT